ncbi:MAG TPA: ROK family protein [Acidimicrobiales bacterium]|nr:ROK family protein [Acidimicrobiales bacterium]
MPTSQDVDRSGGPPVLAVDLGGTRMRAAVVDGSGLVLDRCAQPTPHDTQDPDALIALAADVLRRRPVAAAVVGVPGRVNYERGELEHAPNLPASWVASLTEATLSDLLGVPVALANDADMAAVGETVFGAGRGFADVVYVTISTGVGAGVVLGGRLVHGSRSLAEIGHTVIDRRAVVDHRPATVEALAAGPALARHAAALGLDAAGADLVALIEEDDRARRTWADGVRVAGLAVANLAHLFAPEVFVVGGGVSRAGEKLLAPIRDVLAEFGPRGHAQPLVVAAALGDDAGIVGAAGWRSAHLRLS